MFESLTSYISDFYESLKLIESEEELHELRETWASRDDGLRNSLNITLAQIQCIQEPERSQYTGKLQEALKFLDVSRASSTFYRTSWVLARLNPSGIVGRTEGMIKFERLVKQHFKEAESMHAKVCDDLRRLEAASSGDEQFDPAPTVPSPRNGPEDFSGNKEFWDA